MGRPMWFVNLIQRAFPMRFAAAKATRLPLLGRLADRWLFDGDDIIFLPQDQTVQTIPVGVTIDRSEEMVLPSRVVEHFVEVASVHWIMDFCLCRAAEGCQDYPIELGCLFLGEAALGINPKLGRRVTKEEALAHVQRCREAGLVHMIGRNKMDTVWLGVGPGHQLLTVCNCCPCCCLLGILPHLTTRISDKLQRMPGVSVSINGQCVGCGTCAEGICFADAIHLENGRATIDETCRGCGRCVNVCPQGAIELSLEDNRFVDQAIARISTLVDLD
ncbi:MAG: 4Fe-4S binding protein [Anaerolineae bacterium]|nr:4Fe-4S binding protein [Anaerolineae bacterium]